VGGSSRPSTGTTISLHHNSQTTALCTAARSTYGTSFLSIFLLQMNTRCYFPVPRPRFAPRLIQTSPRELSLSAAQRKKIVLQYLSGSFVLVAYYESYDVCDFFYGSEQQVTCATDPAYTTSAIDGWRKWCLQDKSDYVWSAHL
jgi:hypothetical protein